MSLKMNIVSPELELIDPNPDIWQLMRLYDDMFFTGMICRNCVELSWSSRMTRTAGLCSWNPRTKYCSIRLSKPLLQLRSRKDLVETLIHEMIHALLFVTHEDDNHESHGQKFHDHMYRINKLSGTNITVFHNFHDEVDYYLKHVWRCDGPCRNQAPYYGWVKRSMNRKPGPHDFWFATHQQTCGGNFVKVDQPENVNNNNKSVKRKEKDPKLQDIRNFFTGTPKSKSNSDLSSNSNKTVIPFSGAGKKLGDCYDKFNSSQSLNGFGSVENKEKVKKKETKLIDIRSSFSLLKTNSVQNSKSNSATNTVIPFSGKGIKLNDTISKHSATIGQSLCGSKKDNNDQNDCQIIETIYLD